jgi:hypothetical protein
MFLRCKLSVGIRPKNVRSSTGVTLLLSFTSVDLVEVKIGVSRIGEVDANQ